MIPDFIWLWKPTWWKQFNLILGSSDTLFVLFSWCFGSRKRGFRIRDLVWPSLG